jgi:hypothetical protein
MPLMVLTANRLRDGEVIYLAPNHIWCESLQQALATAEGDGQGRMTALGEAAVIARQVVEPYLMPVADEGGLLWPLSQREKIRAAGPTTRLDLGKQSAQGDPCHV